MKYFVISGEASGDLHAGNLIAQIKLQQPESEFIGWGGDCSASHGMKILKPISELAFMGFVEVLQNLNTILKNFKLCKKQILQENPDAIIFVDYPGFNLKMLKWAKKHNFKTFYFISPNVWAWKTKRIFTLRDFADKLFVILPFEKDFYAKYNIEVEYYGNPIVDIVKNTERINFEDFCRQYNLPTDKKLIALMPGSRKQELRKNLPIICAVAKKFPDYQFVITGAQSIDIDFYNSIVPENDIPIIFNKTYQILTLSYAAVVKSGTATLETALFRVPQVVCYKANPLSIVIAKLLSKVIYISLPNLILNKQVVVELIQNDFSIERTSDELKSLLSETDYREQILSDYEYLFNKLNNHNVYKCIADSIIKFQIQ